MNKLLFLLLIFLTSHSILCQEKIDKELLIQDLDILQANLEAYHTGLYTYSSKKEFKKWYLETKKNIDNASSLDFFKKLNELNALIKNGHTRFHISPEQRGKDMLKPSFKIYKDKEIIYIKECYNPELVGKQIVSINSMPIGNVFDNLLKYEERDGNNLTQATEELIYSFAWKFALEYGNKPQTDLEVLDDGEIKKIVFTNIPIGDFSKKTDYFDTHGKVEFSIKDSIALLTVQTFEMETLKKVQYSSKLKVLFKKMKDQNIKHLIIDVRNNGGGNTKPVEELISYIYNEKFIFYNDTYTLHKKWDTSIIPEISDYSKFTSRWAYKKGKDGYFRAIAGNDGMKKRKPKRDSFKGELYILMNGSTLSAAAEFTSFVKQYRKSTFIGDEVGGNKTQNTSGKWLIIGLPNSKILVLIPYICWKMNVSFENDGHGVKPDYYIRNSIQEEIDNEDSVMNYTYELIKKSMANNGYN